MKPVIAIPATAAIAYRAWSRNSLTPLGIVVAVATAAAHALHPWSVFFALLLVFFLTGTAATKVKHDVKARLTHSSSGSPGGEGPRTHVQVLANSVVASVLILVHTWHLSRPEGQGKSEAQCWSRKSDIVVVGIVANYAAVAADTFSSELGILSTSQPRLITSPWRVVPPGTNGGVTLTGLLAGLLGSFIISLTATVMMPFCGSNGSSASLFGSNRNTVWDPSSKAVFLASMTLVGLCGSLLDSLLGALLQASVVDVRTGKVVEGDGGRRVPVRSAGSLHVKQAAKVRSRVVAHAEGPRAVASSSGIESSDGSARKAGAGEKAGSIVPKEGDEHRESRRVETGMDILSNNGVNLLMALMASVGAVVAAALVWDVPLSSVMPAV